jgi:oligo-alginate lyase
MKKHRWIGIMVGLAWLAGCTAPADRSHGGLYTPERLANIRTNVERYDWARAQRDLAVADAASWLAQSDEDLWRMVPGQDLPRAADATMTRHPSGPPTRKGCLVCGEAIDKFGAYPWLVDIESRPWKIECPNCKSVFPTNDFGAYYASGIDSRGLFDPQHADRSLLFNADHPDPADPQHAWGVDDGYGYVDGNGAEFRFIAFYSWRYWQHIQNGITRLADAYLYSGDKRYAAKAAILIDRLADVYPSMDWKPYADRGWYHSDGGSHLGKIEGRIWECGDFDGMASNYDKILTGLDDRPELYASLARMAKLYRLPTPKGTRERLVANVDQNLLECGMAAIRSGQIRGNVGMHHGAMAAAAIALNREPETSRALGWLFEPEGGSLPGIITGRIDRDGIGDEASPGYSLGWISNLSGTANRLAAYGAYDQWNLYRDFPRFAAGFNITRRLAVLDRTTVNIGDTGRTGNLELMKRPDAEAIAEAFRHTGDERLAIAAYWSNGYTADGLGRNIAEADPEALSGRIREIVSRRGEAAARPPSPHLLAGYGLARLEYGRGADGTAAYMYFGRNAGHGHLDRLNVGMFGYGFDLSPELGYPEFATAWPHRNEWSITTISKNAVVVDEASQRTNWGGEPVFFKNLPGLQAVEVSSPNVYPQTSEYRRMLAFIETQPGQAYAVDIFRVAGGRSHMRSSHGPSDQVRVQGIDLRLQEKGTLAGPEVPFGPHPEGAKFPVGYSWLTQVARALPQKHDWQLEWSLAQGVNGATGEEGIRLRLWDFTPELDEVILFNGTPPRNKPGNPARLRYSLACRRGEEGLLSTFVSVVEPYRKEPQIRSARRAAIQGIDLHDGPVVLIVELADGATDTIMYAPPGRELASGGMQMDGRLGFIRRRGKTVERTALVGGRQLRDGLIELKADVPAWTGSVIRLSAPAEPHSRVWVDAALPTGDRLAGEWIAIGNDGEQNAFYEIESVERDGERSVISLGDVSLVRSYKDERDYSQGLRMNFEPGNPFVIINHAVAAGGNSP